jgi:ubiquinone/menaquinone biosynthesis C-methylase UbiE
MGHADLGRAVAHYREIAPSYDHFTRHIDRIRERAIEALALREGDVVLDAGCGTGWCLPRLLDRVGASGQVIAFDPCPEMLAISRGRAGTERVELIESSAESVRLPSPPDALLFSYTHDLLRSQAALENVLGQAKPGARVAAAGTKLFSPWLFPLNWWVRRRHRGYITEFESLDAPWSLLAERLDDFRLLGEPHRQHYIATGRVRVVTPV